jgi:hypothetical protein
MADLFIKSFNLIAKFYFSQESFFPPLSYSAIITVTTIFLDLDLFLISTLSIISLISFYLITP